jgi:hypothetical protein
MTFFSSPQCTANSRPIQDRRHWIVPLATPNAARNLVKIGVEGANPSPAQKIIVSDCGGGFALGATCRSAAPAKLLLHLVSKLYERTGVIITTNLSGE